MKNVSLYIDLVCCLIVLPMMAMIFPVERWLHHFQWYVVIVGVWLYAVYFVNRMVAVPFLFHSGKRRVVGLVLILLSVAVTLFLAQINLYNPKPSVFDIGIVRILPEVQQYQQAVGTLFVIVEAFSFAVGLLEQVDLQKARQRSIEAERDRAEIELYKAQIKPHFMFNTLNSLYGLFLTGNSKALESLEKFISMTRYIHTTSRCDYVALSDEMDYIRQYVGLQSLRLNSMTGVDLNISLEDPDLKVPPMLLITFVENCFKHGVSPVEKCCIHIDIKEKDGRLEFRTDNRIFPVKRIGEHMGIANCRKRLELLYPGRHVMTTSVDGTSFKVYLSIDLTK